MNREVYVLVFEFVISLVTLLGSGFLLYEGKATEVAVSAVTAVISFWFARRMYEDKTGNTPSESQAADNAAPAPAPVKTGAADPTELRGSRPNP